MSCLRETRRALEAARTRRAHLSSRAMLKLLARIAGHLERRARRVRARLDPAGGADEAVVAATS
ncbi:MAG TPA: hypothetical protein RMH99_31095 [Sandaracinaceae bacterium LLY-WYZ-13_1]|nr:hypothetical protein [Sandaracinaceae bacterium LLY-WYZ-13_1]